jgi:hypothetical protein
MPLRIALTGEEHGIELHFVLAALSRAETLARLDGAFAAATDPGSATAGPSEPQQEG